MHKNCAQKSFVGVQNDPIAKKCSKNAQTTESGSKNWQTIVKKCKTNIQKTFQKTFQKNINKNSPDLNTLKYNQKC